MSHLDREDARRLQRNVDANHQSCFNNSTGHTPRTSDWDTSEKYPRYAVNEPHGSVEVNVGWERLSPSTQDHQNKLSQGEDPDGEPLEMDSGDPELTRKRNELREIEEQIIQKKVALALKNVEPFMKKTIPGFCNEESDTCTGESLRDRVNVILQQRQSLRFLSKVPSPKKCPGLRKDSLPQEEHPLKLRVRALMKKRRAQPCVLHTTTKVFDGISSAKEVNSADEGFQRFLSILNKGVDMDLLSRIVNDDSEELLNIPTEGNEPSAHFRSESQRSHSSASLPGPSQNSGGENKAEPARERSHNQGILSHEDQRMNDRGANCFGSSRQSKSPVVEKKKKKKNEETNPKMDEQREQLQNILKTLGLDLEVEEMSKLADRTQERLYGKKHESRNGSKEQEGEERVSQRHYSNSSSSSSSSSSSRCSSCSSRSTSRSLSPSPSRHGRSHSRDSSNSRDPKPRLTRGRSSSGDRSRDGSTKREEHRRSKEPQKLKDRQGKDSTYQHPSYQMFPHPHPGGLSAFPAGPLPQYSQSTPLHSEQYSTDTPSCWTYSHGAIPASFYPSGFSNPQNTYHHFPDTKTVYSHHNKFEDLDLLVNPDLSTSEGQSGSASGLRCLQVVSTGPASQCIPRIQQLTKRRKKRCRPFRGKKKHQKLKKRQQQIFIENRLRQVPVQTPDITKPSQNKGAERSEEVKQQPTEEEIKANLRKRLEAFNQMVKQKLSQPAASQLLKSVECQDYV